MSRGYVPIGGIAIMHYEYEVHGKGYTEESWTWAQAVYRPEPEAF